MKLEGEDNMTKIEKLKEELHVLLIQVKEKKAEIDLIQTKCPHEHTTETQTEAGVWNFYSVVCDDCQKTLQTGLC